MKEDWAQAKVDELISPEGIFCDGDWVESKDQDPEGDVRLIQLADIGDGVFRNKSKRFLTPEKAKELNCTFINKGDIILARMPEPLGRATLFPLEGNDKYVTVVDVAIIRTNTKLVNKRYLLHNINSPLIRKAIESLQSGTTRKRISRKNLSKINFPIAPLPEQRSIVAKIEELFSELDNGIANLKKAQEQLKIYRQAVLKKAFESDYSTVKMFEISDVRTGSTPKRGNSNYWKNGSIPWVTSSALNNLFVNKANELITHVALKETNCKIIPKGSLLVAMYGEGKTRGKCSELNIDAATNQAIATITMFEKHQSSKKFIKWFFIKNYEEIRLLSSGGVQPNLNLSIIKNTVVPFPSPQKQHQIVQEIESRLSVCDKLEESIKENLLKAEALRQSILKKAFAGRLLSKAEIAACKKEKDWESAEKLLARIKHKQNKK